MATATAGCQIARNQRQLRYFSQLLAARKKRALAVIMVEVPERLCADC